MSCKQNRGKKDDIQKFSQDSGIWEGSGDPGLNWRFKDKITEGKIDSWWGSCWVEVESLEEAAGVNNKHFTSKNPKGQKRAHETASVLNLKADGEKQKSADIDRPQIQWDNKKDIRSSSQPGVGEWEKYQGREAMNEKQMIICSIISSLFLSTYSILVIQYLIRWFALADAFVLSFR